MQAVHFGMRIEEVPARGRYFDDASSVGLRSGTVYGVKTLWAGCASSSTARESSARRSSSRPPRGSARVSTAVTGERVVTSAGGFNPAWQRHVAEYALSEPLLARGPHRRRRLRRRPQLPAARPARDGRRGRGRDRARGPGARDGGGGHARGSRSTSGEFDGAISVHSIEHVPDPERAVAEVRRVTAPGGTAVLSRRIASPSPPRRDHRSLPLRRVRRRPAGGAVLEGLPHGPRGGNLRIRALSGARGARARQARCAASTRPPPAAATRAAPAQAEVVRPSPEPRARGRGSRRGSDRARGLHPRRLRAGVEPRPGGDLRAARRGLTPGPGPDRSTLAAR